jgi:hypothetical protein
MDEERAAYGLVVTIGSGVFMFSGAFRTRALVYVSRRMTEWLCRTSGMKRAALSGRIASVDGAGAAHARSSRTSEPGVFHVNPWSLLAGAWGSALIGSATTGRGLAWANIQSGRPHS